MEWIQGVERQPTGFELVFVDKAGARRLAPFKEIRSKATRLGSSVLRLDGVDLANARVVPAKEFLFRLRVPGGHSDGQLVFEMHTGAMRVMLPAATLILGLLGTPIPFGARPMEPSSLDRLFVQTFEGAQSRITFAKDAKVGRYAQENWFLERLRWLSGFRSARDFWASIHDHAEQGMLGLRMPNVRVTGTVVGRTAGDCFLATRLHVDTLVPGEEPLPFALALNGKVFDFHMPSAARPMLRSRDESLLPGIDGWRLSDHEWDELVSPLLTSWSRGTGRRRLDAILEKLGTGNRFQPTFVGGAVSSWLPALKRSGTWDKIRTVLIEHRSTLPSRHQLVQK